MSNAIDFEQQDKEYIANTYGRFNVCFEKGKGSLLWDVDGKEYIDLGSGIGVTAFGVDDDEWTEAVTKQSHALNHISNLYYSLPQIELAKQLCAKTGMKKVFFSNSGAESNECAIKAARKYSHDKYGEPPCLRQDKMYSLNISSHLRKALFIPQPTILMRL